MIDQHPSSLEQTLLKLVKSNALSSIRDIAQKDSRIFQHEYQYPHFKTLLQIACSGDLISEIKPETIDVLLELGADRYARTETDQIPGWHYAVISKRADILKSILNGFNKDRIDSVSDGNTALHWAIKGVKNRRDVDGALRCIRLLVEHDVDINKADDKNNTPLHYACRYGNQDLVLELLKQGASLACRNDFDQLAMADICTVTLKKHLDNCLEIPEHGSPPSEQHLTVTYNYKSLMPPPKNTILDGDVEDCTAQNANVFHEMDVVLYVSQSNELQELLKHPLITSFLYMKWYRTKKIYYLNLLFYINFSLVVISYVLFYFSNSKQQPSIRYVVLFLFALLVIRELFQFIVAPKLYILNVENWLDVSLIVITSFILGLENPGESTCKQLSAVGILLVAIELILLIGQHPKMAENVTILRTVSKNFYKFLIWYTILIVGFALSFHMLFKKPNEKYDHFIGARRGAEKQEDMDFFEDLSLSVFKTIVMATGEFDASDLDFKTYPMASRAIFVIFVFIIAIGFFNLLNRIAVSDSQLETQIARARHIAYCEKTLMGSVLPKQIIERLKKCLFLWTKEQKNVSAAAAAADTENGMRYLAGRMRLFPKFLPQYRLTVRLKNKDCQVVDPVFKNATGKQQNDYSKIMLDRFTAQETHAWLQNKKAMDSNETTMNAVVEMLAQQQRSIEDLRNALSTKICDKSDV